MKSVKALLFVLMFSLTLLAGCSTTTTEAPAEDAAMEEADHSDDAMEADGEAMEDKDGDAMEADGEAMEEKADGEAMEEDAE